MTPKDCGVARSLSSSSAWSVSGCKQHSGQDSKGRSKLMRLYTPETTVPHLSLSTSSSCLCCSLRKLSISPHPSTPVTATCTCNCSRGEHKVPAASLTRLLAPGTMAAETPGNLSLARIHTAYSTNTLALLCRYLCRRIYEQTVRSDVAASTEQHISRSGL